MSRIFRVRGIDNAEVLELRLDEHKAMLILDGQLTLRGLRRWISQALLLGTCPKDRTHAQVLAAVEAALRSPNLTYVSSWLDEAPGWIHLLTRMATTYG